jgi:hypothetical protein
MWYDHRQVFGEWRKTFRRRIEGSKVSKILRERRRRLDMALYRNTKVARAWMSDIMDKGLGLVIVGDREAGLLSPICEGS